MSRKHRGKKHKAQSKPVVEAAPEEVLAEGSGPVEADADVDSAAAHAAIDPGAPPAELAAAAEDVGRRQRKRRAKAAADAAPDDVDLAAAEAAAASREDADAVDAVVDDDAPTDELAADAVEATDDLTEELNDERTDERTDELAADAVEATDERTGEPSDAANDALAAHASDELADELTDELADAPSDELAADAAEGAEGDIATDDEPVDDGEVGATLPTSAANLDPTQFKHLVEALVFASDKPLTVQRLRQLTRVADTRRLEQTLEEIAADYAERGIVLQQVSGGYQFRTRTQFSSWVQQLIAGRPVRLSRAQLETLAIIAYRQPITRPEIDDIRGVDSSGTLKVLMDRALIRILGKKEEVGRPMLYGTTREFLDFFSLGDLRELPTLREYSELTDESRQVMSDRLGLSPDGSDDDGSGGSDPGDSGGGFGGDPGAGGPTGEGDGSSGDDAGVGAAPEATLDEFLASYTSSVDDVAAEPETLRAAADADSPGGEPWTSASLDHGDDAADGDDADADADASDDGAPTADELAAASEEPVITESEADLSAEPEAPLAGADTVVETDGAFEVDAAVELAAAADDVDAALAAEEAREAVADAEPPDEPGAGGDVEPEAGADAADPADAVLEVDATDAAGAGTVEVRAFADGSGATVEVRADDASPGLADGDERRERAADGDAMPAMSAIDPVLAEEPADPPAESSTE